MKKTIFYGSLYDNEVNIYRTKTEEQFRGVAKHAKENDLEIETWGFDVLVQNASKKKEIESWVRRCAKKYMPNVPNVSEA